MAHLHLTVLQAHTPHQATALGCPQRNEFVWNDDFTAFRIVALNWWDDQSYIDYQARDLAYDVAEEGDPDPHAEERWRHFHPVPPAPIEPSPAPVPVSSPSEDDILF